MVADNIENYKRYLSLSPKIAKGFAFLKETDLAQIPLGKHEIDKDELFAIVMEYQTKDQSESKVEGHHKYIDLQYMISGNELVGIMPLTNQIPVTVNEADDYDLYDIEPRFLEFQTGMFMLFFPNDLHMPGINVSESSTVKKVVVKIKID